MVMTSMAIRFACTALIAAFLWVGPARADDGAARAPSDSCARTAALEAAKDALARGERAKALKHLRRAEALLDACATPPEGATPEEVSEHAEPALAFGVKTHLTLLLS